MNASQIFISGLSMIIIDSIYLSTIKNFANKQIMLVQNKPINIKILGAIACYVFLVIVLNYFIISQKKSIYDAFLLGICVYGVYESTNYAILDNWMISFAIMDTIWGGILLGLTTFIVYNNR